ncbi:MAG: protein-L-isoaspartate(D-aspartate) O-methyltransferase [Candidatus Omnitrophica bacterium]|nr:protein-L-isoaspartate(D-aspartate) O-methyltransferase [Candidatus Omnitrophota bacterium]MDD5355400.1 protein-L-isoaspartate(D-aspartate) O-methyltransferase [Candidatus Omnitrophota bacterium]
MGIFKVASRSFQIKYWMARILSLGIFLIFCSGFDSMDYSEKMEEMINEQIMARGVKDPEVIRAMRKVERHLFVPEKVRSQSYDDGPLPIGHSQTISQPYIVAFMTEALDLQPEDKVLEIGTGSGYQAAVLAEIAKEVYTIEIIEPLAQEAKNRLESLGYKNIQVKCADGYKGWPENAPFDKIIVTAAPDEIPAELIKQLKVNGKMVIPVGSFSQELYLVTKTEKGFIRKSLLPVRFVPMVKGDK